MAATESEVKKVMHSASSGSEQVAEAEQDPRLKETLTSLKLTNLLEPEETVDPNANPLDEIEKIQDNLIQMHTSLHKMMESLKADPSTLMWLVNKWSQADFPQRVFWLVLGAAPLMAIGAAVGSSVLTAMGLTNAVAGSVAGSLANDHVRLTAKSEHEFKQAIDNLSSLLDFAVTALTETRKNLEKQIKRFVAQNDSYQRNLEEQRSQLYEVRQNLISITFTKQELYDQITKLNNVIEELKAAKEIDLELLKAKSTQLASIEAAHKNLMTALREKQDEFNKLNDSMAKEMADLSKSYKSLELTVEVLTNNQITAKDQQELMKVLTETVVERTTTIDTRVSQASHELQRVTNELIDYKHLFSGSMDQVNKDKKALEAVDGILISDNPSAKQLAKNSKELQRMGLFAPKKFSETPEQNALELTVR